MASAEVITVWLEMAGRRYRIDVAPGPCPIPLQGDPTCYVARVDGHHLDATWDTNDTRPTSVLADAIAVLIEDTLAPKVLEMMHE